MKGFDNLHRAFTYSWHRGDAQLWMMVGVGTAVAVLLAIFYSRSFVPAQFLVLSKQWESTTELVHDETDDDNTTTVVDASVTLSGQGLDPVVYYESFVPKGDQYIRHWLRTDVQLDHGGTTVTYRPDQVGYEQLPLGGYCYGEIGWFSMVRRMRCGGR